MHGRAPTGLGRPVGAFTLLELLLVFAIVGILASLLVAGLSAARFRSKTTVCVSQYRQWGIAVNLYAAEDRSGRLPAYSFPLEAASKYSELLPWLVPNEMGPGLVPYGVEPPLWFCPARQDGLRLVQAWTQRLRPGATGMTLADLTNYWQSQKKEFAVIQHSWWVPRLLAGSPYVFPDPRVLECRSAEGWPTKLEDPSGTIQPILSDGAHAVWNETRTGFEAYAGGHSWPPLSFRNLNLLFVDGHVETRGRAQVQWQVKIPGGSALIY